MVSNQGTFEFFNQSFASPEEVFRPKAMKVTYKDNSIMWYIEKFHPKFSYIAKLSKLDWQMSDIQFRGTLFLPLEDSIDENYLFSMDINTARRFIKYHLMVGLFPKSVLFTSPCQQLQSTIKGNTILAMITGPDIMVLNNQIPIVYFDIPLNNGIIHIIAKPLIVC